MANRLALLGCLAVIAACLAGLAWAAIGAGREEQAQQQEKNAPEESIFRSLTERRDT